MERKQIGSWLDNLQQESWQLELLISGFAIFLLIGGWGPLHGYEADIQRMLLSSGAYRGLAVLYFTFRTAYSVLLFALLLHVLLRGIWIAAVGLRYVSGDIDYTALRYHPRYTAFLRRHIGSFDDYLERLERYCSVLFSIAFLIIFCFVSITAFIGVTVALQATFLWITGREWIGTGLISGSWVISIICLLVGLLYFIDFITAGLLKRSRLTARVYYPIYRLMGWLTLAHLYRPLYHNLIDHRFGRRLARLLPAFVLLTLVAVSVRQVLVRYYPGSVGDGRQLVDARNYDDELADPIHQLTGPTLNSKYPQHDYLEFFIPYLPLYDDPIIEHLYPDLEPGRYPGIKLRGGFVAGTINNAEADNVALLTAMSSLHRVRLNGILLEAAPRFHYHDRREQWGLLYMVPTHELPVGEHTLSTSKRYATGGNYHWSKGSVVYFYK